MYLRTTNLILDNQAGKVKVNSNDPKSLLSAILLQASTEGIHEISITVPQLLENALITLEGSKQQ